MPLDCDPFSIGENAVKPALCHQTESNGQRAVSNSRHNTRIALLDYPPISVVPAAEISRETKIKDVLSAAGRVWHELSLYHHSVARV